jgi:cytochrome P450
VVMSTPPPPPRPPGPPGRPLVGNLLEFRKDLLGFAMKAAREYGDVVHYRFGGQHVYMVRHPDLVREVLVTRQHDFAKGRGIQWAKQFLGEGLLTSEGAFHMRQRRLAQPAFHRQRTASYADVMARYAARTRDGWADGAVLEVDREMMALTLAVAAKTLFDAEVDSEVAEVAEDLTTIVEQFPRFALPYAAFIQRLPLPSNRRFRKACERLDRLVYRIIADRRKDPRDRGDLLSMLMAARDEEDGRGMSDLHLRDEVMTLLLAGHETTANALTWTWYLLSQNPEAEREMHAEVDALGGRLPTFEDLPRLGHTERVLAESMRLFPPAWGMGRRVVREVEIGGYRLPAGSLVALYTYVVHRDPRFWPDPERFDPGRFTAEQKAARPKFAYFPFGGGARQCIGEPFAWMEGVLLLATLAQRFRLRLVPGHRVVPQALITLRPRHGMRMVAEERHPAV